ncbi:MAG: LuxR C-terminal-related transcriptional regulator [Coriobacteriales bacterium]|nr:LuxR C-terminal-related transcriptional regulator [Coriobacteriales bacterium]
MSEIDVITPSSRLQHDAKPDPFPQLWLILGVVGSSFAFAYMVLLFFLPWHYSDLAFTEINVALSLVCVMLVLSTGALYSDRFRGFNQRQILLAVAVVIYLAGMLCVAALQMMPDQPGFKWLTQIAVILCSTGASLFTLLWSLCFATIRRGVIGPVLSTMFLAAGALVLLIASLQEVPRLIIAAILPLASAAVFFILHIRLLSAYTVHAVSESQGHYRISKLSLYTTLITGLPAGVAASYVVLIGAPQNPMSISLIVGLPVLVAGTVMLVDALRLKFFSESLFLRWFSSEVTLPLLALPFLPDEGKLVCCGLLVLIISCNSVQCFITIAEITSFNGLAVFRSFGVSWFCYAVGFGLGICLPWTAQTLFPGETSEIVLMLGLAYLVIVSSQLFHANSITDELKAAEIDTTVKSSLWKEKIDKVVEVYALSPRQHEVLRLLSRGRNAKYIQEAFYISRSTAKAHIYNIYKRLDVHSQQELIDIIENIDEMISKRADNRPESSPGV